MNCVSPTQRDWPRVDPGSHPLPPRAAGPHACTRTNALFRHARRLTSQLSPPCLARLHAAVRDRFDENVGADATGKRREEFERGKRMAALYGSNQGSRLVQKRTKQRGGRNLTPSVRERRQALFSKVLAEKYPESYDNDIPEELVYTGTKKLTEKLTEMNIDAGKLVKK